MEEAHPQQRRLDAIVACHRLSQFGAIYNGIAELAPQQVHDEETLSLRERRRSDP